MRRNPYSTGYVAAKIRENTARRNGSSPQQIIQQAVADMVPIPGTKFAIGKYEVTQELYRSVTGTNPSLFGGPKNPVESVSEFEAVDFCEKLSELTGLPFRLPTEEEWEYAARGGKNYEYAGSNDPDDVAWYEDNCRGSTHPVGQMEPNGYGLYDMSGNVWEWTYNVEDGGAYFAYRGGCWYSTPAHLRVASRYDGAPGYKDAGLGFRLAMDLPNEVPKKNPRRGWYR